MTNLYLEGLSAFAVLVISLLIWLIRQQAKLKKELRLLKERVSRSDQEIAELFSSAILVNERLVGYDAALQGLQAKLTDLKQVEARAQPYSNIIQRAQAGTTITELIQNFGLSADEATLLIRLHGQKTDAY